MAMEDIDQEYKYYLSLPCHEYYHITYHVTVIHPP